MYKGKEYTNEEQDKKTINFYACYNSFNRRCTGIQY